MKYFGDILKGSHSQTLNLTNKQGDTFPSPCVVFSIESISGIDGNIMQIILFLKGDFLKYDH